MRECEKLLLDYIEGHSLALETPVQIVDLDIIRSRINKFQEYFESRQIHYSIKANSSAKVLKLFKDSQVSFDAASVYEIDSLIHMGVDKSRIAFGNTIKKAKDIAYAYSKGVRKYTTDSVEDLSHIIDCGLDCQVTLRIVLNSPGSAMWPLNKKFGAVLTDAQDIFMLAARSGVKLNGISFHVGSQQLDLDSWEKAVLDAEPFIKCAETCGLKITHINLGGGFPAKYIEDSKDIDLYLERLHNNVLLPYSSKFDFLVEPGRGLVGDSGIIVSEVVLITIRNGARWVYLDVGKYNGVISTINEAIKYRIIDNKGGKTSPVVIAGPTCDSSDILYENHKYELSEDLGVGDKVYILSTGAYTRDYSSVNFNGLPPLKFRVVDTKSTQ